MARYSAAGDSCFDPYSNKKITHLTIFSSSEFSSSSSSSNHINNSFNNLKSRLSLKGKPFKNRENLQGKKSSVSKKKIPVSIIVVKSGSVKQKPFWKKWSFGSKKLRSVILLHVICIVFGMMYSSNLAYLLLSFENKLSFDFLNLFGLIFILIRACFLIYQSCFQILCTIFILLIMNYLVLDNFDS